MKYIINDLYILDYILLVITFLFIFFSIWKGFIQSILGLMTWIGSIFITLIFYETLSNYFARKLSGFEFFENSGLSEIIGIIVSIPIIFILSLIIDFKSSLEQGLNLSKKGFINELVIKSDIIIDKTHILIF